MKFKLERIALKEKYTIGNFFIDHEDKDKLGWEYYCDCIEDKVRDLSNEPKIYGETAIPYGTYKVTITFSNRFQRDLPLLHNVPQFEGIRIHSGNSEVDTHGCLLLGINNIKGKVTNSKITCETLFKMMQDSGQTEWTIEIV